jgi:uncharacterized membrane protein
MASRRFTGGFWKNIWGEAFERAASSCPEFARKQNLTNSQPTPEKTANNHWRFHLPHAHLSSAFGDDWFALKAEGFARFFGTPVFLIGQTILVLLWMGANLAGWVTFDLYPFILLNLAFSLASRLCGAADPAGANQASRPR